MVKEEFFWLDCCCVPQDSENGNNGNKMKLIWNIPEILFRTSNILAYYMIDGIQIFPEKNSMTNTRASLGLLQLYQVCAPSGIDRIMSYLIDACHEQHGNRLWCSLERRIGRDLFMKWSEYNRKVVPEKEHGFHDLMTCSTRSEPSRPLLLNCLDRIFKGWSFGLSCFSSEDLEPVTRCLYNERLLPMVVTKKEDETGYRFFCTLKKARIKQRKYAIRLPRLGAKNPKVVNYDGSIIEVNDGWFHPQSIKRFALPVKFPYFFCCSDLNAQIQLQIHLDCFPNRWSSSVAHQLHRDDTGDEYYFYEEAPLIRPLDVILEDRYQREPCIFCQDRIFTDFSQQYRRQVAATLESIQSDPFVADAEKVLRQIMPNSHLADFLHGLKNLKVDKP
jgi:hypothetical protein